MLKIFCLLYFVCYLDIERFVSFKFYAYYLCPVCTTIYSNIYFELTESGTVRPENKLNGDRDGKSDDERHSSDDEAVVKPDTEELTGSAELSDDEKQDDESATNDLSDDEKQDDEEEKGEDQSKMSDDEKQSGEEDEKDGEEIRKKERVNRLVLHA